MKKLLIFTISIILLGFYQQPTPTIYLAGDSTMAEKLPEKRPETGWGEKLHLYLTDNIKIDNRAKNGRSSKSFISEGRWKTIVDTLKEGNYVFIQFGHNDESPSKGDRYSTPDEFKTNLKKYVNETREKKAIPVLLTPVVRRRFDENGNFYRSHGEYPDLVRAVAEELNVPLIDVQKKSEELLKELGEEKSKELFLILKPGVSKNYPEGNEDNTHFNDYGAKIIASLVAEEIAGLDIDLKNYVKKN